MASLLLVVLGIAILLTKYLPTKWVGALYRFTPSERQRALAGILGAIVAVAGLLSTSVLILQAPLPSGSIDLPSTARPIHSLNRRMDDELQQAWKELGEGRIAYEPSRTMTEGEPEDVVVRIARGDTIDTQSGFVDRAWVERLRVSGFMSASLTGAAGDFEIVPVSSEGQALVGPSSDWRWRVTPLRGGERALHLRVTARIRLSDGTSENHDLLVKTAQINVRANPRWRVGRFWSQNWQWILGSPIVLGLLGWLGARVLKRGRARNPIGFRR